MISRINKLAGLTGLVALAATLSTGQAQAAFDDVYSAGHSDVNVSYDSGSQSLHLNYDFGSNAVINGSILGSPEDRESDTITVFVGTNALGTGPAALPAPFGGNPLWIIPQTSTSGKPFLGIGAESIDPGLFQGDTLSLSLTGISLRPSGGEMVLWQIGSESSPLFNSADGFSPADHLDIVAGGHDHYAYGFSQAGAYELNFTASGTLLDGTALSTSGVYRFQVGPFATAVPEPGSLALMGLGLGTLGLIVSRRRKGDSSRVVAG